MKQTKILLAGLMALASISCEKKTETAATVTAPVDAAKIKTEIQSLETAYANSLNEGRPDGAAEYYADDAVSYPSEKAPIVGHDAIVKDVQNQLSKGKGMKATFTTNEVHVSNDGNQVVELGAYQAADSANVKLESGNFIAVFVMKDGKYRCLRDMAVSDTPKKDKK